MNCPSCQQKTKVVDSVRTPEGEVYRRHRCDICSKDFYTVEFEVENDKTLRDIWRKYHRGNDLERLKKWKAKRKKADERF